ncbi:hypothetical protein [Virgibacillus sp. YIM 98842]|uniref:hypothetical protein n=1 Tax=Virgibacillus sp. YIM 98842 TaxID=2663533 RepID=UPI0013DC4289|nr:hypothetical protein [Virgibacillus sp. YIM 98842]
MKEKLTIFIILLVTVIGIVIAWLWLQNIIEDYNLDSSSSELIIGEKETGNQSLSISSF